MDDSAVLDWLLAGDVAVRYRTSRDLLGRDDEALRQRIAAEGDGAALLAARRPDGHWGRGFYQPKWTSSHYTLLELKDLGAQPDLLAARETVDLVLRQEKGRDGGLNPSRTVRQSDVCINGMALGYAAYFGADPADLESVVDFVQGEQLADGGFNCQRRRRTTRHSSVHSTVCVMEGITEYLRRGYRHRAAELTQVRDACAEFFLRHHLHLSERSGDPMNPEFMRLHHPPRWHFDVLRGLEAFVDAEITYAEHLADALLVVQRRRGPDGRWPVNRAYAGASHLPVPRAGSPSRWVTLRSMRVLAAYSPD